METKICIKCNQSKPISEFYKRKDNKSGFRNDCKKCNIKQRIKRHQINKKRQTEYYQNNKNTIKEKQIKYYQDNRQKILKHNKKYYKKNKEKISKQKEQYYQNNKEILLKQQKQRNQTPKNKLAKRIYKYKRKAIYKKTNIILSWLKNLKESAIYCIICNLEMNDIQNHPNQKCLDHIIPLNIGGLHIKNNVRFICRSCNAKRPKDGRDINNKFYLLEQNNKIAAVKINLEI